MKKIAIILLIGLAGCKTISNIPYEEAFYGLDFRPFPKQGFLITPEKYQGGYESIGLIRYTYLPEANYRTVGSRLKDGSTTETKAWIVDQSKGVDYGLDTLYSFCINMGADAIMNFKSIRFERKHINQLNPVTVLGFELSGFAIKRKD